MAERGGREAQAGHPALAAAALGPGADRIAHIQDVDADLARDQQPFAAPEEGKLGRAPAL